MAKVIVGQCPDCGRDLKVKESGLRNKMGLTCKCGARTTIYYPQEQNEISSPSTIPPPASDKSQNEALPPPPASDQSQKSTLPPPPASYQSQKSTLPPPPASYQSQNTALQREKSTSQREYFEEPFSNEPGKGGAQAPFSSSSQQTKKQKKEWTESFSDLLRSEKFFLPYIGVALVVSVAIPITMRWPTIAALGLLFLCGVPYVGLIYLLDFLEDRRMSPPPRKSPSALQEEEEGDYLENLHLDHSRKPRSNPGIIEAVVDFFLSNLGAIVVGGVLIFLFGLLVFFAFTLSTTGYYLSWIILGLGVLLVLAGGVGYGYQEYTGVGSSAAEASADLERGKTIKLLVSVFGILLVVLGFYLKEKHEDRIKIVKNSQKLAINYPLHAAVMLGDLEKVKDLLRQGANVHRRTPDLETPLLRALKSKKKKMVRLLAAHGAARYKLPAGKKFNRYRHWPLYLALQMQDKDFAHILLRAGANVNEKPPGTKHLIYLILRDMKSLKIVIKYQANLEARDRYRRTPLMRAARFLSKKTVKILLRAGARCNSRDRDGLTPLMHSLQRKDAGPARLLLAYGARVHLTNKRGRTALFYAVGEGSAEAVRLLLAKGARVDVRDTYGTTPLQYAKQNGKLKLLRLLKKSQKN